VRTALDAADSPAFRDTADEVRAWLAALVPPDVLVATPDDWLDELPRYLEAGRRRLEGLQGAVDRDRERIVDLEQWSDRLAALQAAAPDHPRVLRCRWLLEEYRVSVFAQGLGTREPVSPKRLRREFDEVEREVRLD
jgi:ATP-dependent helicase HrpA